MKGVGFQHQGPIGGCMAGLQAFDAAHDLMLLGSLRQPCHTLNNGNQVKLDSGVLRQLIHANGTAGVGTGFTQHEKQHL